MVEAAELDQNIFYLLRTISCESYDLSLGDLFFSLTSLEVTYFVHFIFNTIGLLFELI